AFSRETVPAIYLSHEPPPIWKVDSSSGADCRPAGRVSPRVIWTDAHRPRLERLQEMESQKLADIGAIIMVERRVPPHIRHCKVQPAIAIDIGHRDTSTHLRFSEPQLWSNIIVSAICGSHEERVVFVSTDVGTRLQYRIVPGISYERFITRTHLL